MKQAALISILIHLSIVGIFSGLVLLFSQGTSQKQKIKVEIKEVITVTPPSEKSTPEIQLNPTPKPAEPPKVVKKVFGLSKDTLQGNEGSTVSVKAGNTIAKEIDQEKINPEDAESLPIPTEEYLVTQMPRLKSEIRIPYPAEARSKNIEGVVVMDILIDEKGKIRSATLIEGPGFGLNEAALKAIYQFEFSPAVVDKKPVAVRIRYSYRFVLN